MASRGIPSDRRSAYVRCAIHRGASSTSLRVVTGVEERQQLPPATARLRERRARFPRARPVLPPRPPAALVSSGRPRPSRGLGAASENGSFPTLDGVLRASLARPAAVRPALARMSSATLAHVVNPRVRLIMGIQTSGRDQNTDRCVFRTCECCTGSARAGCITRGFRPANSGSKHHERPEAIEARPQAIRVSRAGRTASASGRG